MKKIAYITDIHLDEQFPKELGVDTRKNWQWILKDVASKNIDEVIFGGDIGELASNEWFFLSLKPFKLRLSAGNHDQFQEIIKYYRPDLMSARKELYYAFEDDFFKYIFLDSSLGEIGPAQFTWFEKELHTGKKIALFIHHPLLTVNSVIDKLYPLKNREKIKSALFQLTNKVFIFCGHYHCSDEKTEKNITQLVTLAASYQIEKNSETLKTSNQLFGYRIIQIDKDNIESALIQKEI